VEKLLNANNDTKKYFVSANKSLESNNFGKNNLTINEELEFEMISSSISENSDFLPIFEKLNSLIVQYRKVINENVNDRKTDATEKALIIEFSKKEKLSLEFIMENVQNYDYNQIIDLIDWDKFENEIKSRFDHLSRLALFESQNIYNKL